MTNDSTKQTVCSVCNGYGCQHCKPFPAPRPVLAGDPTQAIFGSSRIIEPKPNNVVAFTSLPSAAEVIGLLTLTPAPDGLDDDQIRIWNIYEKARLTALKKNLAYGSSVLTKGALTPELNADAAIRVRMGDKISRLRTLLANPEKNMVSDESISDTMMDLATYALLWLIAKEKGI